jgi:hypothetical protein
MHLPEIPPALQNILIPASVSAGVMLGLLLIFRREWIVPIATAIAMITGMWMVSHPSLTYLPRSAETWLFWKILPICIFTVPLLFSPLPVRLLVLLILSGEAFGQIFSTVASSRWRGTETIIWISGMSVGATAFWFVLERLSLRAKDWSIHFLLILMFSAAAALLGMGASALTGSIGGVLAAIVVVSVLFSLVFRNPAFMLSGLMCWSILLIALLGIGYLLNDNKWLQVLLILSTVGFAWLGQLPAIERMGGWTRFIVRMILILVPLAGAIGLALPTFLENMKGELY